MPPTRQMPLSQRTRNIVPILRLILVRIRLVIGKGYIHHVAHQLAERLFSIAPTIVRSTRNQSDVKQQELLVCNHAHPSIETHGKARAGPSCRQPSNSLSLTGRSLSSKGAHLEDHRFFVLSALSSTIATAASCRQGWQLEEMFPGDTKPSPLALPTGRSTDVGSLVEFRMKARAMA